MATMNVSLPNALRAWIDEKVDSGSFATASDYVRDLVRRDRDHQFQLDRLNELLAQGERSGIDPRPADQIIEDVIASGRGRAAKRVANG